MNMGNSLDAFYRVNLVRGISLITLAITIIVVIILAGAVILALNQNNPINMAKDAIFRNDLSEIQGQLDLYVTNQYSNNQGNFDERTVNGKVSDYATNIIKYDTELIVENGHLVYVGTDPDKINVARDMGLSTNSDLTEVNGLKFNKPDLSYFPQANTKAVMWDSNNIESEISISDASSTSNWYDYSAKKWANIYTNNNENKAYWVWIPRYAYKIDHPNTTTAEEVHIIFLNGTSNNPADGSALPSGYTVHPAFTFDEKPLSGIWVAKFEASSSTPEFKDTDGFTGGGDNINLQVRVKPSVYSWRNISIGTVQTVCMNMVNSNGSIGTTNNIDTHQMKNIEWGAVAYLSQSIYGQKPWINPYGDWSDGSYKLMTGYSGETEYSELLVSGDSKLHPYNDLVYGGKSSTTGNIYGVYDMLGGAFEMTAAILDNGNVNIGIYGENFTENNKIKQEYKKYYDIYEPGDEEKEGGTYYSGGGIALWESSNTQAQNIIRKRLTDATYDKFINNKGDGIYEMSNSSSYFGRFTSGSNEYEWLISTTRSYSQGAQYTTGWNNGYMLIGYSYLNWFLRGGTFSSENTASIFYTNMFYGDPIMDRTFRPVLISGLDL